MNNETVIFILKSKSLQNEYDGFIFIYFNMIIYYTIEMLLFLLCEFLIVEAFLLLKLPA